MSACFGDSRDLESPGDVSVINIVETLFQGFMLTIIEWEGNFNM